MILIVAISLFLVEKFFGVTFKVGDEAQHLKNRKTNNAKAMSSLSSEGRVLLTGTPIENSVSDLLSLHSFPKACRNAGYFLGYLAAFTSIIKGIGRWGGGEFVVTFLGGECKDPTGENGLKKREEFIATSMILKH